VLILTCFYGISVLAKKLQNKISIRINENPIKGFFEKQTEIIFIKKIKICFAIIFIINWIKNVLLSLIVFFLKNHLKWKVFVAR